LSYQDRPSDDELLEFLRARGFVPDFYFQGFPTPFSRGLAMALYRQHQRLQRIEVALVRAGLTNLEDFEREP
jgi:hypothetical protein